MELVALEPRKPVLREYTERPLGKGEIRVKTTHGAPKHGTELNIYRGTSPSADNYFDYDWNMFLPKKGEDAKRPFLMHLGNMWVGNVTEKADDVEGIEIGQRVTSYGSLRSTHTLKAADAFIMPDGMSWKEAVCFEPVQFALAGVRDGHVRLGDTVVVFGLGAIGLITAQVVKLAGAAKVIVVDPIEVRRKVALDNGADVALDPTDCDVGYEVKRMTDKRGADATIETSGSYPALQAAIRGCAYASNIAVVGWYKECKGGLNLGWEAHFNLPNLIFSRACSDPNREYPNWSFDRLCKVSWDIVTSGKLNCENVVDPVVRFEDSAKAYEEIDYHPERSVKLGVVF